MRDIDGMEFSLYLPYPEAEKALQLRELWGEIVILPDEFLKKFRVVGQVIVNLRRGEAVIVP